ncbi:CDGSH iron-sulfur domain-containing protein 1-like [Choloepus didactylus]|uniref:CDGSH iron-sulfur domain-containing protein 1-like n=1 Tax=Choloepus didactylus TaxID=27675 RepID=UPI00189CC1C2|nr:CDGSH iron-sulfur domain-containing protein 1-like [Choloepus didactylus]
MSLTSSFTIRVEWIAAVTITAATAATGYLAYKRFYIRDHHNKAMVNLHIQKDNPKVVNAFDMEDLGDKAVYCHCWRSKKFPLCDGSHTKHNEETGGNMGPLIIKKKEA